MSEIGRPIREFEVEEPAIIPPKREEKPERERERQPTPQREKVPSG